MEFDLDLAKKQAPENPVYYVQYAHARAASILREAHERGFAGQLPGEPGGTAPGGHGALFLLAHPSELALARLLLRYPEVIYDAAAQLEPHRLTYFAQELAGVFNGPFYRDCRVLPSDRSPGDPPREVSESRLKLVAATKQVLANLLGLIGVSAPERMERLEEEAALVE